MSSSDDGGRSRWPLFGLLLLFSVVLVRHAWVGDDAYITFRTVRNFVEGEGLTWNLGVRVQAYTHPLWMFLMSAVYGLTREVHFSSMFVSIAISVAAVWLAMARLGGGLAGGLLVGAALISSKAFMDHSASGLENPLTHLLLALFFWQHLQLFEATSDDERRGRFRHLAICACGLALNRMDAILFCAPALVAGALRVQRGKVVARELAIGFCPFVAWELFSLVYYGFPFPNTAYAKLAMNVDASDLVRRSAGYYLNAFDQDPLTLTVIGVGLVAPLAARERRLYPLAIGIGLYLVYIMRIGGDFMMGRFFAAPCFLSAVLLGRALQASGARVGCAPAAVTLGLGLVLTPRPTLSSGQGYASAGPIIDERGVADERAFYFPWTGLVRWAPGRAMFPKSFLESAAMALPRKPMLLHSVGISSFAAPRDAFIVDAHGLADPLIARMPREPGGWRVGHVARQVPAGYFESLSAQKNLIKDKETAKLFDHLQAITTGPLFSADRWRSIAALLFGS